MIHKENKMIWKYGILREKCKIGFVYSVHELYTDDNGHYTSCTVKAIPAVGETAEEVRSILQMMLKDCDGTVYEEVDGKLRKVQE